MERIEFENKLRERGCDPEKQAISNAEYTVIEKVYMFHPAISNTEGKEEIADLFAKFGMSIIKDMLPRAETMEKLEKELRAAEGEVVRLKELIREVEKGGEI